MRTTIKDIAKATGVSAATVSLVLNDRPHQIAPATRERIKKAAQEMQYIPNQAARGLLNKQSKMIGFICEGITSPHYLYLAQHMQYKALDAGYSVIPYYINAEVGLEEIIARIYQIGVQGIILLANTDAKGKKILECIQQLNMHTVLLETAYPAYDVDTILASREQGIHMAVDYLVEKGHTKIGCITGGGANVLDKDAIRGYQKALKGYHIADELDLIYRGDYQIPSGEKGVEQLLEKGVTAIITMNEATAYGIYRKIKEKHMRMADNFEVVSYNNIVGPENMNLVLTTVEHPLQEMAEYAVERLIQQVESKERLHPITYRYQPHIAKR